MKNTFTIKSAIRSAKNKLTLFTVLSGTILTAQPILQRVNLQTGINLDVYPLTGINTSSILSTNGANVTWNLSGASIGSVSGTFDFVTVASTGYAAQYPSANFAFKFTSGGNTHYNLSVVTNTVIEDTAINVGTGGLQTFLDNRTTLVFPFTYSLSLVDTYQKSGQSATSVSHFYDAYGTVIVGTDTLHNLVRDMSTDNGVSQTQAVWWNVNPIYPVLQVSSGGSAYFKLTSATGLNKNTVEQNQLSLFPNPAGNKLQIRCDGLNSKSLKLTVTDILGRSVLVLENADISQSIDLTKVPAGAYYVRLQSGNQIYSKKFIKE